MDIRELQRYLIASPEDQAAAQRLLSLYKSHGIPIPPHIGQLMHDVYKPVYDNYPIIKFRGTDWEWMIVKKIEELNYYLTEFHETPDIYRRWRPHLYIRYPKLLKITLEDRSQWLVASGWGIADEIVRLHEILQGDIDEMLTDQVSDMAVEQGWLDGDGNVNWDNEELMNYQGEANYDALREMGFEDRNDAVMRELVELDNEHKGVTIEECEFDEEALTQIQENRYGCSNDKFLDEIYQLYPGSLGRWEWNVEIYPWQPLFDTL